MTQIEKADDIEAAFEWAGMAEPKPRTLTFQVKGGFPITLEAPGTAKEIEITVAKDAKGEYKEGSFKITATRKKAENLELKKIKLYSAAFGTTEITDFNNIQERETNAQSVNVSFYSDVASQIEDPELAKKITTEPPLTEQGSLKVWKLTEPNNNLVVKFNGKTICTLKVKRNALIIGTLEVNAGGKLIVKDPEDNAEYSTSATSITVSVTPPNGCKYDTVTVKVGNNADVTLKKDEDTGVFSSETPINLQDGENQVTVKDENGDKFKVTKMFKIKKVADPLMGEINEKVKIEELWLGYKTMDTDGTNKFKAVPDGSNPHKYTVTVKFEATAGGSLKLFDKVSLIVKGGTNAMNAMIKDESAGEAKTANGADIFVSNEIYYRVQRNNNNKYVFTLENGGKTATYEVTCTFEKK
ncbi:MAG: hypothetical protein ACTTKH_04965 [Treponema sp.]